MKPTDLSLLREPSRPALSPDGQRVAVTVGRIDLTADHYRGDLWVLAADGSTPAVQYTHGCRDTFPSWSPDGRWLAFLRAHPGVSGPWSRPQLWLMPSDGGEPFPVTSHHLGVSGAVWSPDGHSIAYLARVPEPGRYGTDPAVGPAQEPPRRITEMSYKRDLVGYKIDQRRHVWMVDVPEGPSDVLPTPTQLTEGDFDHAYLTWSPDARELAVVSARHEDRDVRLVQDVFLIDVTSGKLRQVTDSSLVLSRPAFSPDGREIYVLGFRPEKSGRDVFGMSSALWAVDADGLSAPRRVTPPGLALPSDRSPDLPTDAVLIAREDGVLVEQQHRGAVRLCKVSLAGELEELLGGPRQVLGFDTVGDTIVAAVGTDRTAGEVVSVMDGEERVLTDLGSELRAASTIYPMDELHAVAPDGYPLHGFVVRPDGAGPHPVLVFIYGGPFVMAGWHLFDEAQVYAEAGYAVVLTNERGRCGYGEEHGRAVMGKMGAVGSSDILSLLDAAVAQPDLDASRVGVIGGSYGGFMTSWLVTQTDRFAAAVSERALNDWDRSGDIGYYYPDYYIGESVEELRSASPITHVDNITTPMLLIHSENDVDTPLVQAEKFFFELKLRGKTAEMLIFPGEGHDLTRSGLPSHRVARLHAVVDWFDRWLKPA